MVSDEVRIVLALWWRSHRQVKSRTREIAVVALHPNLDSTTDTGGVRRQQQLRDVCESGFRADVLSGEVFRTE